LIIVGVGIVQSITYCFWDGRLGFLFLRLLLNLGIAVLVNAISIIPGIVMSMAEIEPDKKK